MLETLSIPTLRQVVYDTYANFPTSGLDKGDLAWATDRKCLYRWSGSAWESIGISSRHGDYSAIGDPADYPESSLYQADDQDLLYMQVSSAWKAIIKKQWGVSALTWHNQLFPAIGSDTDPEKLNDNITDAANYILLSGEGDYGQILFPTVIKANKLRTWTTSTSSPHFKVEYRDIGENWQTLIADFEPNGAGSWQETEVNVGATDSFRITWISGSARFNEAELVYS